jgi:hypothetical protein
MSPSKIRRPLNEMTDALECQLKLLEDYSQKAFGENQECYAPEVATKLRLLVGRFGSNKPLLFKVAEAIGMQVLVVLASSLRWSAGPATAAWHGDGAGRIL